MTSNNVTASSATRIALILLMVSIIGLASIIILAAQMSVPETERISFTDYTWGVHDSYFEMTVKNTGSVELFIVQIEVNRTVVSTEDLTFNPARIDAPPYLLKKESSVTITISKPFIPKTKYDFVVVTGKGNRFSYPLTSPAISSPPAIQIEPSFAYYHVDSIGSLYILREWPDGQSGYDLPSQTDIGFKVVLTNNDPQQRNLVLDNRSALYIVYSSSGTAKFDAWYIASAYAFGLIANTYNPVTLPFNVSTTVYFASATEGTFSPFGTDSTGVVVPANLALYGKLDGSQWAQNMPFITLRFS